MNASSLANATRVLEAAHRELGNPYKAEEFLAYPEEAEAGL